MIRYRHTGRCKRKDGNHGSIEHPEQQHRICEATSGSSTTIDDAEHVLKTTEARVQQNHEQEKEKTNRVSESKEERRSEKVINSVLHFVNI